MTVCAADRGCLFGEVMHGELVGNRYAQITHRCWEDLPNHYPHVRLDAFVVMPNHVHGVIVLADADDAADIASTDPYARIHAYIRAGRGG